MACVYLIRAGEESIYKIGMSGGSPIQRLSELQTGNAKPLTLCITIECKTAHDAVTLERLLHKTYGTYRLQGEWFMLSANDIEDILRFSCSGSYQAKVHQALSGQGDDEILVTLQKALKRIEELERETSRQRLEIKQQAFDEFWSESQAFREQIRELNAEIEELRARLTYHKMIKPPPPSPSWWQRFTQLLQKASTQ